MFRDRRVPGDFDRALGIENLTWRLKIPQLQVVGLKAVGCLSVNPVKYLIIHSNS